MSVDPLLHFLFCSTDVFFDLDTNTTLSYRDVSIVGSSGLEKSDRDLSQTSGIAFDSNTCLEKRYS